MTEEPRAPETWLYSERTIPSKFVRPAIEFTEVETASGIVLLAAAVIALIWANSPAGDTYVSFWDTHIDITIGPFHFFESFKDFVNDGLMAIFFFVVGLEIKRELAVGELRDPKVAALPALAALGGMLFPALIYLAFTIGTGGEATRGWGVPMATDIAFSLGIVALLGSRVSVGAKLFLLALAIADDIGAIAVIAIFYTADISYGWLALAIVALVVVYGARRAGVRALPFYVVTGTFVWFAVLESGVHATLAGVALGLITPAHSRFSDQAYRRRATWLLERYEMDAAAPRSRERLDENAIQMARIAYESVPPLNRLERALHPWSSFVIVPIFALANAGVRFVDIDLVEAVTHPVALGVAFGLVLGKLFGITLFTWLGVRLNLGRLPPRTRWSAVFGLALIAGIGFTVALFISELAFIDEALKDRAKIGIFIGSAVAGIAGFLILRRQRTPQEALEEGRAALETPVAADVPG